TIITAAASQLTTATAPTLNIAPSAARRRKGVVIRDQEETAIPSIIIHTKAKSKDKGKGFLVEEPKPLKKQAQIKQDEAYARELERKPQIEAQATKNIMVYLKNMVGFKMDFFKGMSYDDIRPIFENHFNSIVGFLEKGEEQLEEEASKALKRKSESSEQQVVKKQKFNEEVEELKKHLQIFPNDEDAVYTEATPLAIKLIKEFGKEDLEMLWQIVQQRFASSKPKKSLDDFLLNTLKAMFKKSLMLKLTYGIIKEAVMVYQKSRAGNC
nr:hypothetical protein [Tanacetum cinerariifolium]